jgi:hypothetical protein
LSLRFEGVVHAFAEEEMLASEVITVSIRRSFAEVHEFLADPMNFTRWASVPNSIMEPLGGTDWLVDLPSGRMVIRLAARNSYGVFDYQTFWPGEEGGPVTPARLVPNEEGADFSLVWFWRPGLSEEQFRSQIEWARSDLQRLKTLLEGG